MQKKISPLRVFILISASLWNSKIKLNGSPCALLWRCNPTVFSHCLQNFLIFSSSFFVRHAVSVQYVTTDFIADLYILNLFFCWCYHFSVLWNVQYGLPCIFVLPSLVLIDCRPQIQSFCKSVPTIELSLSVNFTMDFNLTAAIFHLRICY